MKSTLLAIVNPKAGVLRDKSKLLADFVKLFENQSSDFTRFEFVESEGPGHATLLAKKAADSGIGLCLAVGGDGTMNEVAQGLLFSQTALGIIPLGSGNGLARHLGISMEARKAFIQMLRGKNHLIDSGLANEYPYFLAAGIGFEGTVAHEFAKQKSRGFSQYILSAIKAYFSFKHLNLCWELDGKTETFHVFTMALANGSQYGNNAQISPISSIHDGWLNRAVVSYFQFWQGPGLFYKLMTGRLKDGPIYSNKSFHKITISTNFDLIGHVDGEPVNFRNQLNCQINPNSLLVRLPEGISGY